MNNQQQKAIGIGVGAFVATALVARSRLLQAAILVGGAGARSPTRSAAASGSGTTYPRRRRPDAPRPGHPR